jgi:hypothetical protein
MDLATGSAGVLLALGAALNNDPVYLPFLRPVPPAEHPAAPSLFVPSELEREEVKPDGTP